MHDLEDQLGGSVVAPRCPSGKVVEQSPASGKTAPQNAQVLIYLGAFRP